MNEFPSNSHKNKQNLNLGVPGTPDKKEKVIERVVTGVVLQRKKTFGEKVKDAFVGGEWRSASSYVIAEVLLPALRNTIVDATTKGIERMIYGDVSPRSRHNNDSRSRIAYNTTSSRPSSNRPVYLPGQAEPFQRNRQNRRESFNDIVLESRAEAETVVDSMGDVISQYEFVTVADVKDMIGEQSSFVDRDWGWSSIRHVDIRQIREGWLVSLPPIEPL